MEPPRSQSDERGSETRRRRLARGGMGHSEKKSHDHGWYIVLIDESGYMLQPIVRRTRAPKGETPILYSCDRHDRLSAITGITVSPVQHRLGLHFQIHDQNINFERVIELITLLHRHLRGKFILVLDRYDAHRKAVRLLREEHPDWFEVEWLPAYAPDLNPVEMVWNHSKYSGLFNFIPEDVDDLHQAVTTSLGKMRTQTSLLRSFSQYAGLELYCSFYSTRFNKR